MAVWQILIRQAITDTLYTMSLRLFAIGYPPAVRPFLTVHRA